jgi:hypothetical protein
MTLEQQKELCGAFAEVECDSIEYTVSNISEGTTTPYFTVLMNTFDGLEIDFKNVLN